MKKFEKPKFQVQMLASKPFYILASLGLKEAHRCNESKHGEIYGIASYPRFDPNDFMLTGNSETDRIQKSNIQRWFENESHLAELWNQQRPLEREYYDANVGAWVEGGD